MHAPRLALHRAFAAAVFLLVPGLGAQIPYPCTWAGGNGGDWVSPQWAPQPLDFIMESGIPIPLITWPDNDRAVGSGDFVYVVAVPDGRVNLNSPITISVLSIGSGAEGRLRGGTLSLEGYSGFTGSAIANDGLISLGDSATLGATSLAFLPSGLTVSGGGTISLLDEASSLKGTLLDFGGSQLVRGAGQIGGGAGLAGITPSTVVNRGTFLADAPPLAMTVQGAAFTNEGTARALGGGFLKFRSLSTDNPSLIEAENGVVDFQDFPVSNSGTLRAKAGGILQFQNQTVSNAGGLIEAVDPGSLIQLRGDVTLDGGTLRRTSRTTIQLQAGTNTFSGGLLVQGRIEVLPGASLRLRDLTLTGEPGTILNPQPGAAITSSGGPVELRGQFDGNGVWGFNSPLSLTGPLVLNNLQLDVGDTQPVNLTGSVTNHGIIRLLDGPGTTDTRLIAANGAVLGGSGQLRFVNANANRVLPASAGAVLTNAAPHLLTTEVGGAAVFAATFVNTGTTESAGAGSVLQFQNPSLTNAGLLQARDGGSLRFNSLTSSPSANFVIANVGGTLRLGAGSSASFEQNVLLRGGTIDGQGTLNTSGATIFDSLAPNPITITDATVVLNEFQPFTVRGNLTNSGTIFFNDGTIIAPGGQQGSVALTLDGDVTIGGTGRLLFATPFSNFINAVGTTTPTLTLGPAQTVTNLPGARGLIYPPTVNQGLVEAVGPNPAGSPNIEFVTPSLSNAGIIGVRDGGVLFFNATNLTIQNTGGTLRANSGGFIDFRNNLTVVGGQFAGSGGQFLASQLTLDGATSPITINAPITVAPGQLTLRGPITNHAVIQLAHTSGFNGSSIQIDATVGATLSGTGVLNFGSIFANNLLDVGGSGGVGLTNAAGHAITNTPGHRGIINPAVFVNQGLVEAVGPNPPSLPNLTLNSGSLTNSGVISSRDSGVLFLNSPNVQNAGGFLRVAGGATFQLANAAVISGGTLDGTGAFLVNLVTLNGSVSPVTNATTLSMAPGQLNLRGSIVNQGTLAVGTGGIIRATSDGCTLGGSGSLRFTGANGNLSSHGTDLFAPMTLVAGATITTAAGAVGIVTNLDLTNQGVIEARGSGAVLNFGPHLLLNQGLVQSADQGSMNLTVLDVANAGGTLRVASGSSFTLANNVLLRGGTLDGTGTFGISQAILDGTASAVTVRNTLSLAAGSTLQLRGGIVNDGLIAVGAATSAATVQIGALGATLSGSGALRLGGPGANYLRAPAGNPPFTLAAGATITTTPASNAVIEAIAFTNLGTVEARGSGASLTFNCNATNQGLLAAAAGGTLTISGSNNLVLENASGLLRAELGAAIVLNNAIDLRGGRLEGAGTILSQNSRLHGTASAVVNASNLQVGSGGLTVRGTLQNDADLRSVSAGQTLRLDGPVQFTGTGTLTFATLSAAFWQGFVAGDAATLGAGQTMTTTPGGKGRLQGFPLTNLGVVEARGASAVLDVFTLPSVTNSNLLRAAEGGTLNLGAGVNYLVENAGGVLRSEGGTLLVNALVRGGRVESSVGSEVRSTGAIFDGVANAVEITAGSTLRAVGMTLRGSIGNAGTILSANAGQTILRIEGPVSLSGAGALTFGASGYTFLQGQVAADTLSIGVGQTVTTQPGGQVRIQSLPLASAGIIEARGAGTRFDYYPTVSTNAGVIRAVDSGLLFLGAGASYTVENAGGVLRNESGSFVLNARVRGGRLESPSPNGFYVEGSGTLLDGSSSPLEVAAGSLIYTSNGQFALQGTVVNHGHLALRRTAGGAVLSLVESLTLGGTGELEFGSAFNNVLQQSVGGLTFTNGVTHTVRCTPGATGNIAVGGFVNAGQTVADGTLTINATTFTNAPGGVLRGNGAIVSSPILANQGKIAPGASAGTLSIFGSVTNAVSAVFEAELGGTASGSEFDRLAVSGSFTRGGELRPVLINGFRPAPTDSFLILSAGSLSGGWANVVGGKVTCLQGTFDVVQTATTVTLTNFQRNAAYAAYDAWAAGFPGLTGASREAGVDFDGDGLTNLQEFAFGSDPTVAGGGPLRGFLDPATGRLRLEFPRRKQPGPAFLGYEVQYSSDLTGPWTVHPSGPVTTVDLDAAFELVTFEDIEGPPNYLRRFGRVRLELLP